jgi:hypothetical protein
MGYKIDYNVSDYIYPHYYGNHKSSKGYRHHFKCGLCGNDLLPMNGKEYVMDHIVYFHNEKLQLINHDEVVNNKFNDLLNIQDELEFDLFKLEIIESCLNGSYKGLKHPRFNHVRMNDAKVVINWKLLKAKEDILEYDFQMNTFIPINDYKEQEVLEELD